jgi:hypothetical protein
VNEYCDPMVTRSESVVCWITMLNVDGSTHRGVVVGSGTDIIVAAMKPRPAARQCPRPPSTTDLRTKGPETEQTAQLLFDFPQ